MAKDTTNNAAGDKPAAGGAAADQAAADDTKHVADEAAAEAKHVADQAAAAEAKLAADKNQAIMAAAGEIELKAFGDSVGVLQQIGDPLDLDAQDAAHFGLTPPDDDLGGFAMTGRMIHVRSVSKRGRRRAGREFGPEPTPIEVDDLTEDELAAILADNDHLVVVLVD